MCSHTKKNDSASSIMQCLTFTRAYSYVHGRLIGVCKLTQVKCYSVWLLC